MTVEISTYQPTMTERAARLWRRLIAKASPQVRDVTLQIGIGLAAGAFLGGAVLTTGIVPVKWALLFMMGLALPFVLMVVQDLKSLLLGIIVLEIPIQLDIYFYLRPEAEALGSLGGFNVSLTTISLCLLYALWLAEGLSKMAAPRFTVRKNVALLVYLLFALLSVVAASDAFLAFFEITLLLQSYLLFIYIACTMRTRAEIFFLVRLLLVALIIESVIMVGLRAYGHSIEVGNIALRIDPDQRVGGTIGSPNGAAGFLVLLLAPALGVLITPVAQSTRLLATVAFGMGGVALMLTQSRGGLLGAAISLALFCLIAGVRGWLSLRVPLIAGLIIAALIWFYGSTITARIGNDHSAAYGRVPLIAMTMRMISDHPWLGVGANNYYLAQRQYLTPRFSREWVYTVHNKYLLIWSENGPFALAAYLGFLATALYQGWRIWQRKSRLLSPIALGFLVAIVGQMVHMNVDIFRGRPLVQLLWLITGLLAAMDRVHPTFHNVQSAMWQEDVNPRLSSIEERIADKQSEGRPV